MKEKTFEKVDEKLYIEKLDNGLEVYLYPTSKTKNFYISISVKYGSKVRKYKINNKTFDVIPGSAHFLEHKVMALSENPEISKRINDLGSLANAWTSYIGTNYNIFGSINLIENSVEEEKGIIGEEIDMEKDNINGLMYNHLYKNLFNDSYVKNTVVGERTDIEKITAKDLNKIYNDFYTSNNTFIIVTGSFDNEEVMNTIKSYMKEINLKQREVPKRIKDREKETVPVKYEEIKKDAEDVRVKYAIKINKKIFGIKNDTLLLYYLQLILNSNFTATSLLYEKYKNDNIMINMSSNVSFIDDYAVLCINAFTNDGNKFIENIEKDVKKLSISETEFERKKKGYLKRYIMDFENIEDIEYNISVQLLLNNKIDFKEYSLINNMSYKEISRIIKLINTDNIAVVRTIK
jgi:predicted Zn-dependent peptidase